MNIVDYDAMTKAKQIESVSKNAYLIQHIKNPSEAVCMAAVMAHPGSLQHIKNPSEAVQITAVKGNGRSLCYAGALPSIEVQLTAVNETGWAIQYIENPSKAIQLAAVKNTGIAIQYIKNPSEAVCMAAVEQNGFAIRCIKKPSVEVQKVAVKSGPDVIIYAPKPIDNAVAAIHLVYHPLASNETPKTILNRASKILEDHCPGLAGIYTIGLSIGMDSKELSRTMAEWIESHAGVTIGAEMTP